MRHLSLAALTATVVCCAQPGAPPGGPPDVDPPKLLRIRPDTNAVNVKSGAVVLQFDEVVGERPQGVTSLSGLFLISPSVGDPQVSWHRKTLLVRPRGGYRPNTTYTVTMLPGLTDLDGNVDSAGARVVFSTGSAIARGYISGTIFDWVAEKSAPRAYVEAIALPDSMHYVTSADSLGDFVVPHLPNGRYLLRGLIDQNRNRQLDPRELYDTSTITLSDSQHTLLYAFVHDTLGPSITTVTVKDSVTLRVTFDHAIDTSLVITAAQFTLKRADSTQVQILKALTQRAFDQIAADSARAKHVRDSVQAAVKADSARRADSARVNARIDRPTTRRPAPRDSVRRDTVPKRVAQTPKIAIPSVDILLTLSEPLAQSAVFRVQASGMRSLLGRQKTSDRLFRTEKPHADSTKKQLKDTVAKKQPKDTVKKSASGSLHETSLLTRWLGNGPTSR